MVFWTAFSDTLAAVVTSSTIGHARLSVALYNLETGLLQSTLTYNHNTEQDYTLRKLVWADAQHLCALVNHAKVVIWNASRGVVVKTIEVNGILDICTDAATDNNNNNDNGDLLLLTSKNKKLYVQVYNAASAKLTRKIKAGKWHHDNNSSSGAGLCMSSGRVAVRNGNAIKILSLEDGSKVCKCKLNDADGATSIMTMNEKLLAVTTSLGVVLFHHAKTPGKKLSSIHIADTPSHVHLTSASASGNNVRLLLVSAESPTATLYSFKTTTKAKVLQPACTITSPSAANMAVAFCSSNENEIHALVQEAAAKGELFIQKAMYTNKEDKILEKVEIKLQGEEEDEQDVSNNKRPAESITTTLGPGQAGGEAMQVDDFQPSNKKTKASVDPDLEDEPTIAERLEKLSNAMEENDDDDDLLQQQKATAAKSIGGFTPKKATTESLSQLLCQALESSDDGMLELALSVRDGRVIGTSIHDLETSQVALLLHKLTARLAQNANRAADLTIWLQFLLTSGKIHKASQLRPLCNLLHERVESFSALLQLEGRLSMLASMTTSTTSVE